jgi:hypothetical protein
MQRLRNVLPFIVLFFLRYAYSHAAQIAFFVCYTLLLHKLNQELRTQIALKQDQDRKVLSSIVVSSLTAVGAALLLDAQATHTQRPLFLSFSSSIDDMSAGLATAGSGSSSILAGEASSMDNAAAAAATATTDGEGATESIEDLVWKILAADVCVRLLFTGLKAMVALMPWPLPLRWWWLWWRPGFSHVPRAGSSPFLRWLSQFRRKGQQHGKKAHLQQQQHHHHHDRRRSAVAARSSADMEGLLSPSTPEAEISLSGTTGSSASSSSGSGVHGSAAHAPSRSLGSSSLGRRVLVERCDRSSVYTRKRRIYCLLEGISLLIRSTLPIPAWFAYYAADQTCGDVFIWMYLTFKCMVLSRHAKSVLATLRLACSGNLLEYGRLATREEVQEAGATDCPVCYDPFDADRTVILPCEHVFCFDCACEWLDRERSCPVCRAQVQPNFEGWMLGRSRSGSTSALPCIL